jgi:hypothetical protein
LRGAHDLASGAVVPILLRGRDANHASTSAADQRQQRAPRRRPRGNVPADVQRQMVGTETEQSSATALTLM